MVEDELRGFSQLGAEARERFEARFPDRIAPLLARSLERARRLDARLKPIDGPGIDEINFRLKHEIERLEAALIRAAGVELQATVLSPAAAAGGLQKFRPPPSPLYLTPGASISAGLRLLRRSGVPFVVRRLSFVVPEGWKVRSVVGPVLPGDPSAGLRLQAQIVASPQAVPDCPYWSRPSQREMVGIRRPRSTSPGVAGVLPVLTDSRQLSSKTLESFDTMVVGVRAYASRPDLIAHNPQLLEFVYRGGALLVLYQTPEFDHDFGPYPYSMGSSPQEVTEELAPVTILDSSHRLWQWPNRISSEDFEGWVGERGSKFLTSWDPRYAALTETHDSFQPPQRGGLLVTIYGKGIYVYSAYAFHRQLPQAVPGAFRILANLLALGRPAE